MIPESCKKKKKKFSVDTKNMGVNIDKNEYYEIINSNSAFSEKGLKQNKIFYLHRVFLIFRYKKSIFD